jgi:hypothetical protein
MFCAARVAERGFFVSRHLQASFAAALPALKQWGALAMWSMVGSIPRLYSRLQQPKQTNRDPPARSQKYQKRSLIGVWGYGDGADAQMLCVSISYSRRRDFCGNFVGRGRETGVQHSLERCLISGVSTGPSNAQKETIDCSAQPAFCSRSHI